MKTRLESHIVVSRAYLEGHENFILMEAPGYAGAY